jgi:hypothetical protein
MAQKLKRIALVALAVALVVGLAIGGFLFATTTLALDTTTHLVSAHGLRDVRGTYGSTEMLSTTAAVSSFRSSGQSEQITASAEFLPACNVLGIIETQPYDAFWRVYSSSDQVTWKQEKQSETNILPAAQCNNWGTFRLYVFSFTGPINAYLRVELWERSQTGGVRENDFAPMLRDQAYITEQIGSIVSPTEGQVFQVGDTINWQIRISQDCSKDYAGTTQGGAGWLFVLSRLDGAIVKEVDLGCGTREITTVNIPYIVQPADFSNTNGVCQNALQAELFTHLFGKDSRAVRTIDVKSLQPGKPTLAVSDSQVVEGDGIDINISAPAGATNVKYSLTVQYTDGFVVLRQIDTAQAITHVVLPKAGTVVITASITVDCRASDPVVQQVLVSARDSGECAATNSCPTAFVIPTWVIFLIVGILIALIAVFAKAIPIWPWKLLMILIAVVFFLVTYIIYPA